MKLNRIKVLMFSDWYFPGFKAGGPIQSCRNLVQGLKNNVDFFVFTSDRDLGDKESFKNVFTNKWIALETGERVYYATPGKQGFKEIKNEIERVNPNVIYLNSLFSIRFSIYPIILQSLRIIDCKIVMAPRGMLHAGALQYKSTKKKVFISMMNLLRIPEKVVFHATDDQEVKDILSAFPKAKEIVAAPNIPTISKPGTEHIKKKPGKLELVFLSRVSPKKNLDFALKILSENKFDGQIHITVGGQIEDKEYWEKCISISKNFPSNITLSHAGPIPHDGLLDWLQQFQFFILPTFGENFGHAIFESFLAGNPVIISDRTPWKDLESKGIGWDISLENEIGFRDAIRQALNMGQEEYERISHNCRNYAELYMEINDSKEAYLKLFSID